MEIKPVEKIAAQFELSKESAKYYLGQVQKAFKTEKPPHKLIVEFIDAVEGEELLPKKGRGTNRKTRPSTRETVSHEKLCPHGLPRNKVCADCEFETFVRLTQSE
jgi:hypothetical protein